MGIIGNIKYDIKAIRKYGLISHLKYLFDYKHTIVNMQLHVDYVPEYIANSLFEIVEVDVNDDNILQQWVEIVNDAFEFDKPYNVESAKKYLNDHIYKKLENLYFIYATKERMPVGTYFVGTFKNNPNIGTSGRLAVRKTYQGYGLGKLLVLFGLKMYKEKEIKLVEEIAVSKRDYSIRLYFRCGAIPQFNPDLMHFKQTRKNFFVNLYVKNQVKKIHNKVYENRIKPYLK